MSLLNAIKSPVDLRKLDPSELSQLCEELRHFIIESVLESGGHFSANLGTVELTVALHYVFNTPHDKLIWDVGHQAYGHKVLTGRKEDLKDIRKKDGPSGFPKPSESVYDAFGTGHSSTSISAALGMSEANLLLGNENNAIAVIGDGSLTAGMVWEAINNLGVSRANLLVVINDNQIGIDANDGALSRYLSDLGQSTSSFFDELGIPYSGPIDGHNILGLVTEFERLKKISGPRILHVKTIKGKGYPPAEEEQTKWHAVKYVKIRGEEHKIYQGQKYQEVFGNELLRLARIDEKVIGVTPAMPSGSSMNLMMTEFPDRVFDVGIAEQHAVTFSAGMAVQGLIPFCNIYSSFFQRAYDQFIHDVCLQDLPVVFCLDRAGVVGEDGATHHGLYDIPFLRVIPNAIVSAASSASSLRALMKLAYEQREHPFVIRYPRGNTPEFVHEHEKIELGKSTTIFEQGSTVILNFGSQLFECIEAIEQFKKEYSTDVALVDMLFLKPVDQSKLEEVFQKYDSIITVEDGVLRGGFYSLICELANEFGYKGSISGIGYPDEIIEHASRLELLHEYGLDRDGILEMLKQQS